MSSQLKQMLQQRRQEVQVPGEQAIQPDSQIVLGTHARSSAFKNEHGG